MPTFRDRVSKASAAVIVASCLVIAGMAYAIYTHNTDLVIYLAGTGTGFLFKEIRSTG